VPPSNQAAWDAPPFGEWNQVNPKGPTIPVEDEDNFRGDTPPIQPHSEKSENDKSKEGFVEKNNDNNSSDSGKRKTILPPNINSRTSFRLIQIPQERMRFDSGDEASVTLNRDNLDKNNLTITSQAQASVYYDRGAWFIQDKSDQKTTFKQIADPTEIKDGDIILMGDMMFRFEIEALNKKI
jgi:hypothetical protein